MKKVVKVLNYKEMATIDVAVYFTMAPTLVGHGHAATLMGQSVIISRTDKNKHVVARPKAAHRRR